MSDDLTPQEQFAVLEPKHRRKVDEVFKTISEVLLKKQEDKLKEALQIGGYIFDEFYDGQFHQYETKRSGTPSLEALHAKILLELGEGVIKLRTLRYYVTTAIQARKWDDWIEKQKMEPCVRSVGYTHRTILDTCQGALDEIRIAQETARENLTVSAVRERQPPTVEKEGVVPENGCRIMRGRWWASETPCSSW